MKCNHTKNLHINRAPKKCFGGLGTAAVGTQQCWLWFSGHPSTSEGALGPCSVGKGIQDLFFTKGIVLQYVYHISKSSLF